MVQAAYSRGRESTTAEQARSALMRSNRRRASLVNHMPSLRNRTWNAAFQPRPRYTIVVFRTDRPSQTAVPLAPVPLQSLRPRFRHQTRPVRRSIAFIRTIRSPVVQDRASTPDTMASPHRSRFGMACTSTSADAELAKRSAMTTVRRQHLPRMARPYAALSRTVSGRAPLGDGAPIVG
jgi:hypothetical protein